jgi:hypothetical protein
MALVGAVVAACYGRDREAFFPGRGHSHLRK